MDTLGKKELRLRFMSSNILITKGRQGDGDMILSKIREKCCDILNVNVMG